MTRSEKLLTQILRGDSDGNIPFSGLISLLTRMGFQLRVKGSHHILYRNGIEEILNLQPKGNKAKPYQVKQVRDVILRYRLARERHD